MNTEPLKINERSGKKITIKPNVVPGAVKLVHQLYGHHPFREWWGTVYFKKNNTFVCSDLEGVFCIFI